MLTMRSYCLLFCCLFFINNIIFAQQAKLVLPIGHTNKVNTAKFSPDGTEIVTASNDNTAKIWDASTGTLLINLRRHKDVVSTAQFSPACAGDPTGGSKVVTASWDDTARIWDSKTGDLLKKLIGHNKKIFTAEFSPDGKKIVTASADSTAIIWDVSTGNPGKILKHHFSGALKCNCI